MKNGGRKNQQGVTIMIDIRVLLSLDNSAAKNSATYSGGRGEPNPLFTFHL
jgi:hypothetical protein